MQENIRRKSQSQSSQLGVVYFDYFTASTASSSPFFPWWFLRVPYLCHTKALSCGHKPLKKTSIEGRQRLKVKNGPSFQPFDLFIRNWFHTLLLVAKNPTKIHLHPAHIICHISFTFSPGFVESAVWPHQEFRDRDGKKGSCFTKEFNRELRALFISGRPSGLGY